MDPAVQKHCVNVARTAMESADNRPGINTALLIKASLLHDLAKTAGTVSLPYRVLYVWIKKLSPGLAAIIAGPGNRGLLSGLRKSFYVHINHAELGASLAENAFLDKDIVTLIRNHHSITCGDSRPVQMSAELEILISADEIN